MDMIIRFYTAAQAELTHLRHRAEERGEGVISAAIAVLIVAALGVGAYTTFKGLFDDAGKKAGDGIDGIGK